MSTVTMRLSERELRRIKKAREGLNSPWSPSRHRFMKEMMFRGIETIEAPKEKQVGGP